MMSFHRSRLLTKRHRLQGDAYAGLQIPCSRMHPKKLERRDRRRGLAKFIRKLIIEAMARIPPISEEEEEKGMSSEEIHSNASSSSLRFSTEDDDDESGGGLNGRRKGKTFEELTEAVIRKMREAQEEREKRPEGMTQRGEPSRQAAGVNSEDPHEGLIREMIDLTGMDDEAGAEEDEWRKTLEETVDTLVAEVAE